MTMNSMKKFLNEFSREISDEQILKILDKHYHAEKYLLRIGEYNGDTILDFKHIDSRNYRRSTSNS